MKHPRGVSFTAGWPVSSSRMPRCCIRTTGPCSRGPGRRFAPVARAALAVAVAAVVAVLLAWLSSQASPAWATRYLAAALAPLLLLCAVGISRAGRIGVAILALAAVLFFNDTATTE